MAKKQSKKVTPPNDKLSQNPPVRIGNALGVPDKDGANKSYPNPNRRGAGSN